MRSVGKWNPKIGLTTFERPRRLSLFIRPAVHPRGKASREKDRPGEVVSPPLVAFPRVVTVCRKAFAFCVMLCYRAAFALFRVDSNPCLVQQIAAIASVLACASCMKFSSYRPTEQYKCGAFLRESRREATVLGTYYQFVDQFIAWISSPFPHQEILTKQALLGNWDEIQDSLETKYWQWIDWQRGWLLFSLGIVAFSIFFVFFYILYRICSYCCSSSMKKQTTDARYDACKRNILNFSAFLLIFFNAMVVTVLVISSMYAHHGLDQLPNRVNQCIDDLNLYKRDTDMRIRKLLIDDYQTLNLTITDQLSHAGHNVVDRVKRLTGANVIDVFLNVSNGAQDMKSTLGMVQSQVKELNDEGIRFESEFHRLRNTANEEIVKCVENEMEPMRSMCARAERLLENLSISKFKLQDELLSPETEEALQQILQANISRLLGESNRQFENMETAIQSEIDKKTHAAQNMLKQIGDDLFVVAETISTQLRQINFDLLYNGVSRMTELKKQTPFKYFEYSWIGSVTIASLIILLSLLFLIGVLCGVCGRRPSYYNDDCCVRTTGGKFYSCGIWLAVLLFVFLALGTAILAFAVGNVSSLVCQPLRDPLNRPDIMSLSERYVEIWREKHRPSNDIQAILDQRSPADIIRACQRNETLYHIFEFDKKYHLNQLKDFEKESYAQLENFLKISMIELPEIRPLDVIISKSEMEDLEKLAKMNVSKVSHVALDTIKKAIDELDLVTKTREFEESLDDNAGRPKAVSLVLEQIQEIDTQFAKPLRNRLESLYKNITHLDERLTELQVPVSSLLVKLQHAQALLSESVKEHFKRAAKEELDFMVGHIDHYIFHVRDQMQNEVSSCEPLAQIAKHSTSALCTYTVDTFNGTWMCLLIFLIVEPPQESHHLSSFVTDTYDTRPKPGYSSYAYTDDYHRTYR
ncbi:unnamed protein product [Caenorhabditis auriculariae]|uniref:Uncharacterized protein n=1 Tax=Caenorhabditis auriculariae TaxID=2777116 RepID=A0A8S1GNC6_9PELO|nr:unnamed protein product [Caenorhabditis auriculariae]